MEKSLSWESARNICIVKTLAKLGHFPTRKSEKEAWFLSPLRSETQASFNVSLLKNVWYDFGIGKGGSTIDLIMELKSCSVKEALEFLKEDMGSFSFSPPQNDLLTKAKLLITGIEPLQHPALLRYLYARKIPVKISRKYCSQVNYQYKGKPFFAIGLKNHKGGWELRNKYYKNSSSPKTYSFLERDSKQLIVTEGMFDFLSLATIDELLVACSDVIILNSLAFIQQIETILQNYERVLLFLDNDAAGEKSTHNLTSRYTHIENCSNLYKGYVDLNEKLKNEKA